MGRISKIYPRLFCFWLNAILFYDVTGSDKEGMFKMKGVDYTKQLSKERENYQASIKKNKDAAEKRVADNNERNENIQKKQLDTFTEDKTKMEKSYQKHLGNVSQKTHEAFESNQDDYSKKLGSERDSFAKESEGKRRDFDQRLSDIKNSYRKSFGSERELHQDLSDNQKKSYDQNISDNRKDSTAKIQDYQEKVTTTGEMLKQQFIDEKAQLVRAQEDTIKDTIKDASKSRAELKDRIAAEMKRTGDQNVTDARLAKEYADNNLSLTRTKNQTRVAGLAHDFGQQTANQATAQKHEIGKLNHENTNQLQDAKRAFEGDLRDIEAEKKRSENGSGEFAQVMNAQKGLNEKVNFENKLRNLQNKYVDAQKTYQERSEVEQNNFNDTLKSENMEGAARMERKSNEINANKLNTIAHAKAKNDKLLDNMTHMTKQERIAYEQQLMVEKNTSKNRLDNFKASFNKTMNAMEEKNKAVLNDVTKTANEDKSEFVKKMTDNRTQELFEMKREFGKMMDSTIEDYERRILNYQRDNEHLKMTMDQKVGTIADQSQKSMSAEIKNSNSRRNADQKAQALMNDQNNYKFRTEMNLVSTNFQKKIDKLQTDSDSKLKLLTNDYENKLKELRVSTAMDLNNKDLDNSVEKERMKQDFEAEKVRIVSGYENKITEMKKGHQNQMDQLKDFKRLS
ncbi:MAG TPA: hypothetical protein VNJ08_05185 [Bacteriovoracaceae bacterium]|nr:hypothetical protein [Bacteriovoracaceae bacterium]